MTVTVEIPKLRALVLARLKQFFNDEDSERIADVVMFGELAERSTHGIIRLLPGRYSSTDEEPGPPPQVDRPGPVVARIRGRPGMLVAAIAGDTAIEVATENGLAMVTTVGSRSTSGCLTYYAEKLTNAGLVTIICANTFPFVTPPGGMQRILGTNPIAIAVPTKGYPFITDLSTGAISFGEVSALSAAGSSLAPDVAVAGDGTMTTDPESVLSGGAVLPFGGHKGLGLSMAVELLNGVLAGAGSAPVGPSDSWGHVFIAISLAMFGDPDELRGEAQAAIERLRNSPTRDGSPLRIPGHRSLMARDAALARGTVEVDEAAYAELMQLVDGWPGSGEN